MIQIGKNMKKMHISTLKCSFQIASLLIIKSRVRKYNVLINIKMVTNFVKSVGNLYHRL